MAERGIYTQVVTSAVRPIPSEWAGTRRLQIVVSIDGLQPEHDERRKPATYDRILKHIEGHNIRVHCTVTRQQVRREGYLEEFVKFWSANPAVSQFWISLYTPQVGELSAERLTKADRERVVADLLDFAAEIPEAANAEGDDRVLHAAAALAGGVHLREDDGVRVVQLRKAHHAVPVRRQSGLQQLRLHRVSRRLPRSDATNCRAAFASARSSSSRSR